MDYSANDLEMLGHLRKNIHLGNLLIYNKVDLQNNSEMRHSRLIGCKKIRKKNIQ